MSRPRLGLVWLLCIGLLGPLGLHVARAQTATETPMASQDSPDEWRYYGRTMSGTRFAPQDQITKENVHSLKVAWTFRAGTPFHEGTPLQVGDTLYVCALNNTIIALNAENGTERWRFDPKINPKAHVYACRGVSYHKNPTAQGECSERIIEGVTDARLVAVDAKTGKPCSGFGVNGEVDLRQKMGPDPQYYQYIPSPPLIIGDIAVVGTSIYDGQQTDEPSGVIRAYNVTTGAFVWAWDLGRPGINTEPPEGEIYTPGTPNAWSVFSGDPKLGLVYLPTGNAGPDYVNAGRRTPEMEKFSSSVVALDARDGSVRWHYQTVHNDVWDYDVPSQPVLVDFPTANGPVPAVIVPTKRGEIFVLDRRTGEPLTKVEEKPVPQGGVAKEKLSPTQPFSVGMPSIAGPTLREADMWGLTPLDQLWCRIKFRSVNYSGAFTPPDEKGGIKYPGFIGGSNWGSVSVDEERGILIAPALHMPNIDQLIPHGTPAAKPYEALQTNGETVLSPFYGAPQRGTGYIIKNPPFFSPLGVPCIKPPYGDITAIDLKTQKVLWYKPIGTTRNSGPFRIGIGLPLPMGVPLNGGALLTKSGLVFFSGSQDAYFRALDIETGKELWRANLPTGAQMTPMTYTAPESGRQMVVITVDSPIGIPAAPKGDYVIAYALPAKKE